MLLRLKGSINGWFIMSGMFESCLDLNALLFRTVQVPIGATKAMLTNSLFLFVVRDSVDFLSSSLL